MGDIKQDCVRIVPGVIRLRAALISPRPGAISPWIILMRNPTAAPPLCRHLYHPLDSLHHILFLFSFIPLLPILLSCFLDCCCTKLRCYDWNSSKSFNFMRCAPRPGDVSRLWMERGGPSGEILVMVFGRFGLECNMDRSRSHLMLRKHLAPCVICWTCLQSEASLISRQKQCKQMLCVCSFWTS